MLQVCRCTNTVQTRMGLALTYGLPKLLLLFWKSTLFFCGALFPKRCSYSKIQLIDATPRSMGCLVQHTATHSHCNTLQRTQDASCARLLGHVTQNVSSARLMRTHSDNVTHCNTMQHTQDASSARVTTLQQLQEAISARQDRMPHLLVSLSLTHRNTPQHSVTLPHNTARCNTLQHTPQDASSLQVSFLYWVACVWKTTATHCNTLQPTATHCNTP